MNTRIDANSEEFKNLLAAWLDALKVTDTKLNAYYAAVAALENHAKYLDAARYFKQCLSEKEKNPDLTAEMNEKYRLGLQRLYKLLEQSNPAEAVAAWLQEYQLEQSKQP